MQNIKAIAQTQPTPFFFAPNHIFFVTINLIKFQNRSRTPSGRKVCGTKKKKEKIPKIVDIYFCSHANVKLTHSDRTN